MRRSLSRPTTTVAVTLQAASLLIVASCVLGILISDVARQNSSVTKVEVPVAHQTNPGKTPRVAR